MPPDGLPNKNPPRAIPFIRMAINATTKTRFNTSTALSPPPSHLPTDGAIASLAGSFSLMTGHQRTPYISSGTSHKMAFQHRPHLLNFFPVWILFVHCFTMVFSFPSQIQNFCPNPSLQAVLLFLLPFMAPILHFSLSIVMLALFSSAQFVSREQIRQSSVKCCPGKFRQCCEQRMLSDERIHCGESLGTEKALAIAVCLEKQLHGGESVIERRAHKCCWLLSGGKQCQRRCYDQLRAPTIPPTQKFTFTDECPSLTLNETVPISELNCVTDREAVVHSCFSACLHWWENNRATAGQQVRRFDPSRDCPAFVELNKSESCMIPEELLELARRDEEKGTTSGKKDA